MSQFVKVASVSVLSAGTGKVVDAEGQSMAKHGVTLVDAYVTLGHHDIIAIIEAPDTEAATAASAMMAAQGNFRAETLPATPVSDFLQRLGSG